MEIVYYPALKRYLNKNVNVQKHVENITNRTVGHALFAIEKWEIETNSDCTKKQKSAVSRDGRNL